MTVVRARAQRAGPAAGPTAGLYSQAVQFRKQRRFLAKAEHRLNGRIRVPEVRVIDDVGEQLGVLPTEQALQIARDRGLDLVEVAPHGPPAR